MYVFFSKSLVYLFVVIFPTIRGIGKIQSMKCRLKLIIMSHIIFLFFYVLRIYIRDLLIFLQTSPTFCHFLQSFFFRDFPSNLAISLKYNDFGCCRSNVCSTVINSYCFLSMFLKYMYILCDCSLPYSIM